MHLRYFKSVNTLDELKKERNILMRAWHPDVNKNKIDLAKVQEINSEYDFVYSKLKKGAPSNDEFLKKQAQNIFYSLTNVNGVDSVLLHQTLMNIPDNQYKALTIVYLKEHGIDLLNHISAKVKNTKWKNTIVLTIKLATGQINREDILTYFKNFL